MARIVGYAQADVAPEWLFEAPIHGVRRLIERLGGSVDDFDLIEINEAFAAQVWPMATSSASTGTRSTSTGEPLRSATPSARPAPGC